MDSHCTQGFRLDLPLVCFIKNLTTIAPWGFPLASGTQEIPDTPMRDAVLLVASREAGRFSMHRVSPSALRKTLNLLDEARACSGRSDAMFSCHDA